MTRKFLLIICLCVVAKTLNAQDLIILSGGDEIQAKVTEVKTDQVVYKKYDNLEGPNYTINKNEIFMIRYESGTKDVFGNTGVESAPTGTATIYFYRPKKFASSKPKIIVGTVVPDEVILKLKNGSWHKMDYTQLGERQFATGVYVINPEYFTLDINADKTYYVRCTVLPKGMKIMANMELVEAGVAKEEMALLKEQVQNYVN